MKSKAEVSMETRWLKHKRNNTYIMLEDVEINWFWDMQEVFEFDRSYKSGMNIFQLAEKFKRTHEEIALMICDRAMQNRLDAVIQ